jgi:hypothetical protein
VVPQALVTSGPLSSTSCGVRLASPKASAALRLLLRHSAALHRVAIVPMPVPQQGCPFQELSTSCRTAAFGRYHWLSLLESWPCRVLGYTRLWGRSSYRRNRRRGGRFLPHNHHTTAVKCADLQGFCPTHPGGLCMRVHHHRQGEEVALTKDLGGYGMHGREERTALRAAQRAKLYNAGHRTPAETRCEPRRGGF